MAQHKSCLHGPWMLYPPTLRSSRLRSSPTSWAFIVRSAADTPVWITSCRARATTCWGQGRPGPTRVVWRTASLPSLLWTARQPASVLRTGRLSSCDAMQRKLPLLWARPTPRPPHHVDLAGARVYAGLLHGHLHKPYRLTHVLHSHTAGKPHARQRLCRRRLGPDDARVEVADVPVRTNNVHQARAGCHTCA